MSLRTHRRTVTTGAAHRAAAPPAGEARTPAAFRWDVAVAVLVLAASLAGLLLDDAFSSDTATTAMLRGYDLVNLVVVVPSLIAAVWWARRRTGLPQLLTSSLLAYIVYTYGYHLLGTMFNDLFLLHAAVVASGAVALTAHLSILDVHEFDVRVQNRRRVRASAAVLGLLAAALAALWAYVAMESAITGTVPAGSALVETDTLVHLGMALDLVLLVPLYAGAAVLLWRGAAWGFVLGTIALIAGVLHQVSYMVAMPFQVASSVPGAVAFDPGEPLIVMLYLVGLWLLLGGHRLPLADRDPASTHD